jgi:hypothetical protein
LRTYYLDQSIANNVVSFVNQARQRFGQLSVNNTFRTQSSSSINTSNTKASGLSRHQAGFAIDLNGVRTLSDSQLIELNAIAADHGLAPLRNQSQDLPHFSADPTMHGYSSLAEAVNINRNHYETIIQAPAFEATLTEIAVQSVRPASKVPTMSMIKLLIILLSVC